MRSAFLVRISPPVAFLAMFFFIPIGVLFAYSFGSSSALGGLSFGTSLDNYRFIVTDHVVLGTFARTIATGFAVAVLCVALAMPFAYSISIGPLRRHGDLLLFLVLCSLFSAYIVRVYAWRALLGREGVINGSLNAVGLIDAPLEFLLYSRFALILTLVNVLLPFAVLSLYASFVGVDRQVIEASRSMGASPVQAFRYVTLPLVSRGVVAGFTVCFVIACGDYVTPQLVGGPDGVMVGNLILTRFGITYDWPMGSALAFTLTAAVALTIAIVSKVLSVLGIRDRPA